MDATTLCPICSASISYHVSRGGESVKCPECGGPVELPRTPDSPPDPAQFVKLEYRLFGILRWFAYAGVLIGIPWTTAIGLALLYRYTPGRMASFVNASFLTLTCTILLVLLRIERHLRR